MGSYNYRHWGGKAYQHIDTAHTVSDKNRLVKKYKEKYRLVRVVVTDVIRGKPDEWAIYANIPSIK